MTALDRLRSTLAQHGADAMLVTTPENVRYLSSFASPEDAVVLVTPERAVLLTDGRYTAQAAEQSSIPVEIVQGLDLAAAERSKGLRLAVESDHLTLKRHRTLCDALGNEPIVLDGVMNPLRVVKTAEEIDRLRQAAQVTDVAYEAALAMLRPGVREVEVALEMERVMRLEGAEGSGFDIIVASGVRGAMPHGVASNKVIESGELVTLDFGAIVDGYHADMTRTVAVGEVGAEERRMYDAVLEAQEAAVAAVAPGRVGRDLDAVARDILTRHGLGEYFAHSLGHGTGLHIHEDPRLSNRSDDVLAPGMIVTIEPGVYIPGFTGLRIEDLLVVTESGHEVLSKSPKAFRCV
ncbi:MAG: Xaa-Pro peptidase family protein [Trueperaceae bacterium]